MIDLEYLKFLGNFLGGVENPFVRRGLTLASREKGEIPRVEYHFLQAIQKTGRNILNLPKFPVPSTLPQQGIPIATVLDGEAPAGILKLPISVFYLPILVCGAAGTGKTRLVMCGIVPQLIERGIKVVIWDPEDQFHRVLCSQFPPEQIMAFRPSQFRMNLLAAPSKLSQSEWIGRLVKTFEALYAGEGMKNLLRNVAMEVCKSHSKPAFYHLDEHLQNMRFKPTEREYSHLTGLRNRVSGIKDSFGATFDCEEGFLKKDILNRSVIFRMKGLDSTMANWFQDLFMERLKFSQDSFTEEVKIVAIYEEAHERFSSDFKRKETEIGERLALTEARTNRKYGIGSIFVDQIPGLLPAQVLGNCGTFIVFRLVDVNSVRRISDTLGLNEEQREMIPQLPNRQAVVFSHIA